jgi:hypothetical protein
MSDCLGDHMQYHPQKASACWRIVVARCRDLEVWQAARYVVRILATAQ